MLQAVSHVANSLGHLKTKYVKYLETICAANGIDVQELKNCGSEYEMIEIFFGGYPILVGLKYFKSLKVLKIFGQNTTSLKPLAEVAGTLEELWICEGQLKDLSGIEHCTQLRKAYLYENEIEIGSPLTALTNLEVLHLDDNKLQNISFLESLQALVCLNLGNNGLTEREFSTVTTWPKKLQTLDVSKNAFDSLKTLFSCCTAPSLRFFNIASPGSAAMNPGNEENLMAWLAFHFRFLENLDGDDVHTAFANTSLPKAEFLIAEKLNELAKIDEDYVTELKNLEKAAQRVEYKLGKLCDILEKLKETLPNKDSKREIVKRVLEVAHSNHRDVKPTKKKCRNMMSFINKLQRYNVSLQLESAATSSLTPATDADLGILSHFLNFNCSMKHNYVVGIQHCVLVRQLKRSDMERLRFIEKEENVKIWNERDVLCLLDHYNKLNYKTASIRVFKDVELLKKEVKDKTTAFIQPIFVNQPFYSAPPSFTVTPASEDHLSVPAKQLDKTPKDDSTAWQDLHLIAVVLIEVQYPSHLHIGHLRHLMHFFKCFFRYREVFDASFDDQLKKLKEMNITVEIKESDKARNAPMTDNHDTALENITEKTSKNLGIKDILTMKILQNRCSTFEGYGQCMTVRTPVEISLAYGPSVTFTDLVELQNTITILDLSSLKITRIAGIEVIINLKHISLRDNKITSLKKLQALNHLQFLDVSQNRISKMDDLPETLLELNLAGNKLSSLSFCSTIPAVERLNLTANILRSFKGVETCSNLHTLMAGLNQIKERSELDYITQCTNLRLLDLTGNPVLSWEGYKLKIFHSLGSLLTLDRQLVSKENRTTDYRCGRGMSLDFIDKCCPDWQKKKELVLRDYNFEIIVFESTFAEKLSHITLIDLSRNHFQEVKQLAVLPSLDILILPFNAVRLLFAESNDFPLEKPFPALTTLDLSNNGLTSALLPRLGLKYAGRLKHLILKENQFTSLNCQYFDFPCLEVLDVRNNLIKSIKRHVLEKLKSLDLAGNRLKDIDGLATPNLETLFLSGNKISTCASLSGISNMGQLNRLDCRGNPVAGRRVFVEYVKTQVPNLISLNDASCEEATGLPEVRAPPARKDISPGRTIPIETYNTGNALAPPAPFAPPLSVNNEQFRIQYEYITTKASNQGWDANPRVVHFEKSGHSSTKTAAFAPVYQPNRYRQESSLNFMITGTKMERHFKH